MSAIPAGDRARLRGLLEKMSKEHVYPIYGTVVHRRGTGDWAVCHHRLHTGGRGVWYIRPWVHVKEHGLAHYHRKAEGRRGSHNVALRIVGVAQFKLYYRNKYLGRCSKIWCIFTNGYVHVGYSSWRLSMTSRFTFVPSRLITLCPYYLWNFQTQKVEILQTFRQGQPHFMDVKIFSLVGVQGAQHPLVKNGTPFISPKLSEPESPKFYKT